MEAFFTGFWTTIGAITALVGTILIAAAGNKSNENPIGTPTW